MKRFFHLSAAFTLTAFVFFAGGFQVEAVNILEPRSEQDTETINKDEISRMHSTSDIRAMVEDEFGEDHPMVDVARCESSFRQFTNDGNVLRNPESDAIGIFQILEGLHEEPADKLGFDIFTAEGNITYARKLYDSFGLAPWSPSSLCWDDGSIDTANHGGVELSQRKESTRVPVKVRSDGELEPLFDDADDDSEEVAEPVDDQLISKKLVSGVEDPQVRDLQRLLNDIGYQLSATGPGSSGEETDFFGAKTRAAVKEFQCENDIVCSGGRYTTGYGLVDQETRRELNMAAAERERGVYRIGKLRVRTKDADSEDNLEDQQEATKSDAKNSDSEELGQESLQTQLKRAQKLVSNLAAQINNQ